MRIQLVSLEDGITSCGFRKMAAYVALLNADTEAVYVSTNRYRSLANSIRGTFGGKGELGDEEIDEIAHGLAGSDLVGFSSMTGYADLTRRIVTRLRQINPASYIIWGGIHPIIHPEDAILVDVDAICTGEGEFAFDEVYNLLVDGSDPVAVRNFWFKKGDNVVRNDFLPLMTVDQMETLPFLRYGEGEKIYRTGQGLVPMGIGNYLANDGLGYVVVDRLPVPLLVLRQYQVHRQRPEVQEDPPPERALHGRRDQGGSQTVPPCQPGELPRRQFHGDPLPGA